MAARRKTRKKRPVRKAARKRRAPARKPRGSGDLVVRVAEQMARLVEGGIATTLRRLPLRAASDAAKRKLKDAISGLRRQAESLRQQAEVLEARGAEAAAAVWRPLGDRLDRAAAELKRRLSARR